MKIVKRGVEISTITDNRSLFDAYDTMDMDMNFATESYNELDQLMSSEGLVGEVFSTAGSLIKSTVQLGGKLGSAAENAIFSIKKLWAKIKAVLMRVVKDLGVSMSNIYGKFMKYDKDYKELGKLLVEARGKVGMIDVYKGNIQFSMYNMEPEVLAGVCGVISSYDQFVNIIKKDEEIMNGKFIEPSDFLKLLQKNISKDGKVKSSNISKELDRFVEALGKLTERGETTIPRLIWRYNKFPEFLTDNIITDRFKKTKTNNKENDMKKASAAVFTRMAITGELINIEIKDGEQEKLKKLLTYKGAYFDVMASFLNNKIVEGTLNKSGASITSESRDYFKNLDKCSAEIEKMVKIIKENEAKMESQNKKQEDNSEKKLKSSISSARKEVNKDASIEDPVQYIEGVVAMYFGAMTTFFTTASGVYRSMTNGLMAASFDLIVNCKDVIRVIDNNSVAGDKNGHKE